MRAVMVSLMVMVVFLAGVLWFSGRGKAALAAQVSELVQARSQSDARVRALDSARAKAQGEAETWKDRALQAEARAARIQVPPTPPAAPASAPALEHDLLTAGLLPGLVVSGDFKASSLALQDGQMVWGWQAQAARVPALEGKLTATEEAWKDRKGQADSLGKALDSSQAALLEERHGREIDKALVVGLQRQAEEDRKWEMLKEAGWGLGGVLLGIAIERAHR